MTRATARPSSTSSRTADAAPRTCSAPPATSRSPRSTCSTTSTPPARSGRHRRRRRRANVHLLQRPRLGNRASPTTPASRPTVDPSPASTILLPGPRGAANQVSFLRQEAKELEAINTMDADVDVAGGGRELVKLTRRSTRDADRDDALIRLVQQLNAHWATAHPADVPTAGPTSRRRAPRRCRRCSSRTPSGPRSSTTRARSRPSAASRILVNSAPFRNAREPLAQAFKPLGAGRANAFGVIVNHFKSKGGPAAGDRQR